MNWIYLSPHFDDVALSCAGLVWHQTQAGDATAVWTICAGEPGPVKLSPFAESLHARWQTGPQAAAQRRAEDAASCQAMGAARLWFDIPDCIYRSGPDGEPLYASEEALFWEVAPQETPMLQTLSEQLAARLAPESQVVCPLAIGGHVDHRLTRRAAEMLRRPLWYYADYPYVSTRQHALDALRQQGWQAHIFPLPAGGVEAWLRSLAAHRSQLSSFWPDDEAMRQAIERYSAEMGGVRLWRAL